MAEIITEQREDGKLFAVAGSSRMGKTRWTMERVKAAPRALVWDARGEWKRHGFEMITDLGELARRLRDTKRSEARIAYWWHRPADFQGFCELAYTWGCFWPATIVADEIADVTTPAKAPDGWGQLLRKGLYWGNHIYSLTQRPQECDKTAWGNPTCYHLHRMASPDDQAYLHRRTGIPLDLIESLRRWDWVELWDGEDTPRVHRAAGGTLPAPA